MPAAVPAAGARVRTDGKQFALGAARFHFRGVTYGTFKPRDADGERFPEPQVIARDLDGIAEAGFTVVRTYTPPPDDLVAAAAARGLHLLAGVFWPDWRYLVGTSRRELARIAAGARAEVRAAAERLAGCETVLALSLGNEVPADAIRWVGTDVVAGTIDSLVEIVREVDPEMLVTYANYPTAEYLPLPGLDFLTFNVFLEQQVDLRRYLTRLHHLAGDRPLVLGEIGLDAGTTAASEARQASAIDWQLETALERGVAGTTVFSWTDEWWVGDAAVEGWHFGLTRAYRSPRPALAVAAKWNRRTVADLRDDWPTMSVVVCAYNAEATLDECLRHTCRLDYPGLEIIVVDDGSTDATAEIAASHPVQLLSIPHAGLSVARNEGMKAARGEIVAYLDSDAYPTPEWPYFLALAFDDPSVGGAGGPNVPPRDDPSGAQRVAHAPGGPVHVLVSDDRAEHVPGCNMAFWKVVLEEVGGFDPIYTSAGDDVDLCWKVLDRSWDLGFHPAALVWHHRRGGLRSYLRQQRGYGRAEALVEARHPNRFTSTGSARWAGHIYNSFAPRHSGQRIYRGEYGTAAYQSVYRGGGHLGDLLHQIGIPLSVLALPTAILGLLAAPLVVPAVVATLFLVAIFFADVAATVPPRGEHNVRFRFGVAVLHLLQPIVRIWGRTRHRTAARAGLVAATTLPGPLTRVAGGLVVPADRDRSQLAGELVDLLRLAGHRVAPSTGWDDRDARITASVLVHADLLTSSAPEGWHQIRIVSRLRPRRAAAAVAAVVATALVSPVSGAVLAGLAIVDVAQGWRRARRALARIAGAVEVTTTPAAPVEGDVVIDLTEPSMDRADVKVG